MEGKRVLITGPTGQVGLPVALALAERNEVFGVARFGDAAARARLEAAGVTCIRADLVAGDFSGVPADVDHVANFAVAKTGDFDRDLAANVESLGLLMHHCREAESFLHCSSTAVYQPNGHHDFAETDPLGDNHRPVRLPADLLDHQDRGRGHGPLRRPAVGPAHDHRPALGALRRQRWLARLPLRDDAGRPAGARPRGRAQRVQPDPRGRHRRPGAQALLEVASVPATVVNWAGPDSVSIEDWCLYLGEMVGIMPTFAPTTATIESVRVDTTRMHELIGPAEVGWREGLRRMVEVRRPDLFVTDPADLLPRIDLTGRIALVTGSSRGLGAATAQRLAAMGAEVIVTYRKQAEAAADVAAAIAEAGGRAHVQPLDAGDIGSIDALFDWIEADGPGGLDILVANAAATSLKPLLEQAPHNVERTFAITVTGFLHAVQRAVPLMEPVAAAASWPSPASTPCLVGAGPRPPGRGQGLHGDAGHLPDRWSWASTASPRSA